MNAKQIEKHKDVIKWFCDNPSKGVWDSLDPGATAWELVYDPSFSQQHVFVQNDEYAELRKAQADGKIIELNGSEINGGYGETWNVCNKDLFKYAVHAYRIQPEESNKDFKVGDWVKLPDMSYQKIYEVTKNSVSLSNFGNIGIFTDTYSKLEKWQPKKGEYCVFYNNAKQYIVSRYVNSCHEYQCYDYTYRYDNIAPLEFILTLKNMD